MDIKKHYVDTRTSPSYVEEYHTLCGVGHIWFCCYHESWMTLEVEKTNCKTCMRVLYKRAGLTYGTPLGIVSDKLKEMSTKW